MSDSGGCDMFRQRVNYGQLKLHPFWDPLRGDPRFDKIVASLAPKEKLEHLGQ